MVERNLKYESPAEAAYFFPDPDRLLGRKEPVLDIVTVVTEQRRHEDLGLQEPSKLWQRRKVGRSAGETCTLGDCRSSFAGF